MYVDHIQYNTIVGFQMAVHDQHTLIFYSKIYKYLHKWDKWKHYLQSHIGSDQVLTPYDFRLIKFCCLKSYSACMCMYVFFQSSLDFIIVRKACEPALTFHKLKNNLKNLCQFKVGYIYTNWFFLARCTFCKDLKRVIFQGGLEK